MTMVTVEEVNKAFAAKGIHVELPLRGDLALKNVEVLEKIHSPGKIRLLLKVEYINEQGKGTSELVYGEGRFEKERKPAPKPLEPLKVSLLPPRQRMTFTDEEEVRAYLREAISHLLQDKGYSLGEEMGTDLYFVREVQGFFVNLAVRCDEKGFTKAKELVELRRRQGVAHDYALVVPAFQESLGLPLRLQERWIARHQEYLSIQRIGVYGVDNMDPNRIYSFTIYPKPIELKKYFMRTTQSWPLVRSRYVQERAGEKREK